MSVTVLLELNVTNGAEFIKAMEPGLSLTRSMDGYESLEIVVNQDDPNNVVLIEKWASREQYEKYFEQSAREGGDNDQLDHFLAGEPSIRYYDTWE